MLLSKASVLNQITKAALALGLGKSIFVHAIIRMYMQLHTQNNHEMRRSFLSSYICHTDIRG